MKPRVILQLPWGPSAGRKIALSPGQVLRVGRGDEADLCLAHDRALGKIQFEIDWDGERCRVRHRQGEPTLLGGRPIDQADVPHGGWLRAGASFFTLHVERRTPSPVVFDATPERRARDDAHLAALRAAGRLWAVVDAARDERVLQLLRESIDPARSLYEGAKGDALETAAPHLVALREDSDLLEALVREGWGDAWGIFLAWDESEKEVRRHLRRLLMVEEEESREKLYFRFYDPRVLRTFLPTCTVRQLHLLFGELDAFLLEGETGDLLRFARTDLHALAEVDR